MKTDEFRAWLERRGITAKSVNTRIHALTRLERQLEHLGAKQDSLDAAYDADRLRALLVQLSSLRTDAKGGGTQFRILMPDTTIAEQRLLSWQSWLRQYGQFREEQAGQLNRSDWPELEVMRDEFVLRVPDFSDFQQTSGSYWETEREYKDRMISAVQGIIASDIDDAEAGRSIYAALTPRSGPLLRWETRDAIVKHHSEMEQEFFESIGELARSDQPAVDSIGIAAHCFEALRRRGVTVLTPGEIRNIVFSVRGCARPDQSCPVKVIKADELAKRLIGEAMFKAEPSSRAEIEAWLGLLERIFIIMRDTWEWQPRDLFDVQGMAWMVLDPNSAVPEGDDEGVTGDDNSRVAENVILYGPPGTGKTYSTAAEAVRLIDGSVPPSEDALRARYHALVKARQIAFVTFHQSYAYEDFVEGLRPVTDSLEGDGPNETPGENGPGAGFRLEPKPGIFREICQLAELARKKIGRAASQPNQPFNLKGRKVFKMSLGRAGLQDFIYDAAIEGGYAVLGWGGDLDWSDPRFENWQAVHDKWNEVEPGTSGKSGNIAQLWSFRGFMKEGDIIVVSQGNTRFRAIGIVTGPYRFDATEVDTYNHRRDVDWVLVLDEALPVETIYSRAFSQASCYRLNDRYLNQEALTRLLSGATQDGAETEGQRDVETSAPDQFVLIIDEINRANISKVFGELITLIEPDKRLGMPYELTVRLPYSRAEFGVPSNLHIVATMNTADRSIALLDTALRRRFRFRELLPASDLLYEAAEQSGVDLPGILAKLNDRIEYLFDREHQIGHAYFMGCETRAQVDAVMRDKVIPLLAEYFYEDWGRVAQVLGETDERSRSLDQRVLTVPSGFDGAERHRWSVKAEFAADAYDDF